MSALHFLKGLINRLVKKKKKKTFFNILCLSPFLYLFQTLEGITVFVQTAASHTNIISVGLFLHI